MICQGKAFEQADLLLNDFYLLAALKTKILERDVDNLGPKPKGHEELLRKSQRTWLEVRDTTCELFVTYGFIISGRTSVVDECKARLTMQRIADLQREIGSYLE